MLLVIYFNKTNGPKSKKKEKRKKRKLNKRSMDAQTKLACKRACSSMRKRISGMIFPTSKVVQFGPQFFLSFFFIEPDNLSIHRNDQKKFIISTLIFHFFVIKSRIKYIFTPFNLKFENIGFSCLYFFVF